MNRKPSHNESKAGLKDLPPVLIPSEAAALLRLKISTLYRHISEDRYSSAVKRGKTSPNGILALLQKPPNCWSCFAFCCCYDWVSSDSGVYGWFLK